MAHARYAPEISRRPLEMTRCPSPLNLTAESGRRRQTIPIALTDRPAFISLQTNMLNCGYPDRGDSLA